MPDKKPDIRVVRNILFEENMEILQITEEDPASKGIVVDVLRAASGMTLFIRPRVESTSTHGTGCTLSAALVCALAQGDNSKLSLVVLLGVYG